MSHSLCKTKISVVKSCTSKSKYIFKYKKQQSLLNIKGT